MKESLRAFGNSISYTKSNIVGGKLQARIFLHLEKSGWSFAIVFAYHVRACIEAWMKLNMLEGISRMEKGVGQKFKRRNRERGMHDHYRRIYVIHIIV